MKNWMTKAVPELLGLLLVLACVAAFLLASQPEILDQDDCHSYVVDLQDYDTYECPHGYTLRVHSQQVIECACP